MILLCPIVLGGCSSDDDDWMDLDSKHLVGTWSTGTEGTHKYLKFENDGTGYYALLNGASFLTNYLFCNLKSSFLIYPFLENVRKYITKENIEDTNAK